MTNAVSDRWDDERCRADQSKEKRERDMLTGEIDFLSFSSMHEEHQQLDHTVIGE